MEPTMIQTILQLMTSGGYGLATLCASGAIYLWVQMQSDRKQSKADIQELNDKICAVLEKTLPELQQATSAMAELKAAVVELRISLRRD